MSQHVQHIGLSDEQVTGLLDALDDAEANVRNTRRLEPRNGMRGTAVVIVKEPGHADTSYLARMRNVSRYGVAFLLPVVLEAGTEVRVQLPVGPKLSLVERRAIVRRCSCVGEGVHEIGADFRTRTAPEKRREAHPLPW